MIYNYDFYSDIGGRKENEDSVSVTTCGNNLIAVLADGLGGQGDGKEASETICQSLMLCGKDGRFPDVMTLEAAFTRANSVLMSRQKNDFHMKSTAVYLCVQENQSVWGHVGDSRLYHVWNGRLCDYTLDHSVSEMSVLMGRIKREDIPHDSARNRLLRVMGSAEAIPDLHSMELKSGIHGFLLCSDGLWEYLTDREIETAFSESTNASQCISRLRQIRECRCRENSDNNTAIVLLLKI